MSAFKILTSKPTVIGLNEIAGLIPGTLTILNVDKVWNGVHPAS